MILGTKFQLRLTILIFWTKFAQKSYFQWQIKVSITIDPRILHIPISLNWNHSEVAILLPKVCPTSLYAWGVTGSFEVEVCTTFWHHFGTKSLF